MVGLFAGRWEVRGERDLLDSQPLRMLGGLFMASQILEGGARYAGTAGWRHRLVLLEGISRSNKAYNFIVKCEKPVKIK